MWASKALVGLTQKFLMIFFLTICPRDTHICSFLWHTKNNFFKTNFQGMKLAMYRISSVQSLSRVWLCDPMECGMQASLSITNSQSLLRPMSIEWCHPTISSSVIPFSSCLQSFPASRSFQMSQFFTSGGQRIGVSASASVLPMNTQDWSPLGWMDLLAVQGTHKSLFQHHSPKASILGPSALFIYIG